MINSFDASLYLDWCKGDLATASSSLGIKLYILSSVSTMCEINNAKVTVVRVERG